MIVPGPAELDDEGIFQGLSAVAEQFADPRAPAWLIVPSVALRLIGTDNVGHSHDDKQADLIAQLTPAVTIGAETPRLQGVFQYRANFRRALNRSEQNRISHYGSLFSHTTIIRDFLFFDLGGNARETIREGFGPEDDPALLNDEQTTQVFSLLASPNLRAPVGRIGSLNLRYSYGRAWFERNTGPIESPIGTLEPLRDTTYQQAQAALQMPGTIIARLQSTLVANASEIETRRAIGSFKRASVSSINEYQLAQSLSAIGSIGYESLASDNFPRLNGQGESWDIGARWQPNPDSSVMLTYGRHNLITSVSALVEWRVSPLTNVYASYTEGIANFAGSLIGQGGAGLFGPGGVLGGIDFDDNPTLGRLGGGRGLGVPVSDLDGVGLHGGNFFRRKLLMGQVNTQVLGENITVTGFRTQREALTGTAEGEITSHGLRLAWNKPITPEMAGRVLLSWREAVNLGEMYRFSAGTGYAFSQTVNAGFRYDHLHHDFVASGRGFVVNTITVWVRKTF